jgi:hypothetical protein
MSPRCLFCAFLLFLTNGALAQNQVGRDEQAALGAIYKNLQLSPLTLNRQILAPNSNIQVSVAFVSTAKAEMAVPELSKGYNGGGHIIGFGAWHVKRVDKPAPTPKAQSPFGEKTGPGFVIRIAKLRPGENSRLESFLDSGPPTYPFGHTLDLRRLNLESGEYELTLVFSGVTKCTLTSSARFQVDNPDQAQPKSAQKDAADGRPKGADQAGKAFYGLLRYGKVETTPERIRLGLPFAASCRVTLGAGAPVLVPPSITSSYFEGNPMIAIADYYFMRKGETQKFHLGSVPINTKTPGKVMPGETFECLLDVNADKFKLLPGAYELILEIRGLPLSAKDQLFVYKHKKQVNLGK